MSAIHVLLDVNFLATSENFCFKTCSALSEALKGYILKSFPAKTVRQLWNSGDFRSENLPYFIECLVACATILAHDTRFKFLDQRERTDISAQQKRAAKFIFQYTAQRQKEQMGEFLTDFITKSVYEFVLKEFIQLDWLAVFYTSLHTHQLALTNEGGSKFALLKESLAYAVTANVIYKETFSNNSDVVQAEVSIATKEKTIQPI